MIKSNKSPAEKFIVIRHHFVIDVSFSIRPSSCSTVSIQLEFSDSCFYITWIIYGLDFSLLIVLDTIVSKQLEYSREGRCVPRFSEAHF